MVDFINIGLAAGIAVTVCLSAFFSLTETALLSVNRTRLRYIADQGDDRARAALELLKRPRRLLSTILIGNNVVNILASTLMTALAINIFDKFGLAIAAGVTTFVLLLAGEVGPKSFANEHAEWASLRVARPIRFFVVVFRPLEVALSWLAKHLLHVVGGTRVKPAQFHTEEEIKVLLKIGREAGHIGSHEAKLIRAVFEFNDLELADIMRPAPEIAHLKATDPLRRVTQLVAQTGHSRFPVVDETGKKPVGLVLAKDLILMTPDQLNTLTAATIIRAMPQFSPEHHVADALDQLKSEGSQMAAIVDEKKEMVGLVTLEDLLEEIVGDITDEYEMARRRLERERAVMRSMATPKETPAAEAPPPTAASPKP